MGAWTPEPTQTALHVVAEELAGIRETLRHLAKAIPESSGAEDGPPTMELELKGVVLGAIESLGDAIEELREGADLTPDELRQKWQKWKERDQLLMALVRARLKS